VTDAKRDAKDREREMSEANRSAAGTIGSLTGQGAALSVRPDESTEGAARSRVAAREEVNGPFIFAAGMFRSRTERAFHWTDVPCRRKKISVSGKIFALGEKLPH
jgi:hypothetical protein